MLPRNEHPNPQWERESWQCLNGEWEFDFDFGVSAKERKLFEAPSLPKRIIVPFCPESKLSGIGYTDFIPAVCYRKTVTLTKTQLEGTVLLHFGAVDYKATVYINGKEAFVHRGGYASFAVNITPFATEGENVIFVYAEDDVRSGHQPAGKQSGKYASHGCYYTRTTGIWQSVWLEFLPKSYVKKAHFYPDPVRGVLFVEGETVGNGRITACASYEGKEMAVVTEETRFGKFKMCIKPAEIHLWEPGHGRLYDLTFTFGEDKVKSYFGLRDVALSDRAFMLNGKPFFQRFVLDQGFYPEGIYTAKDEEQLEKDIHLSLAAGFNGARLHQKVFEARFLYHCDRLGYPVWEEHANWGMNYTDAIAVEHFTLEWEEVVERDFNHPAIIGWCPYNETWTHVEKWSEHHPLALAYRLTKAKDSTRPCIAVSGNYHIDEMEVYDIHNYMTSIEAFRNAFAKADEGIYIDSVVNA
ncbi:MAG: beta-galactosidase, partial [Clostridia bacterium]|nr:beta-galactosidase [Clostridia bacterium]